MMQKWCLHLLAIGAVSILATSAEAQPKREGFFGTAGAAYSTSSCSGDFCEGSESNWGQLYRIGYFLRNDVAISVDASRFSKDLGDGFKQRDNFFVLGVTYYPSIDNNYFLTAGLGAGRSEASDGYDYADIKGSAYSLGIGYDFSSKDERSIALTPFLKYYSTFGGRLYVNGLTEDGFNAKFVQIGLGLTFF